MKIAVRQETPSLEADFVAELLQAQDEVVQLGPHDTRSHEETYDLVVCVGPVRSRPLATSSILIVMGQTRMHRNLNYDAVVTSCEMARENAVGKFGHDVRVFKQEPPILGLVHGRRRLVEERKVWLNATDDYESVCSLVEDGAGPEGELVAMSIWSDGSREEREPNCSLFDALEFNSLVKGGAVGWYPYMHDGYDIMVRRHLALGGRVVAPRNQKVLGDLADLVDEKKDLSELGRIKPVGCAGRVDDYVAAIREIVDIWR